jgi:predicted HTH domain antitoxin
MFSSMKLTLEIPDVWQSLLGLDAEDAPRRATEMLVIESYREGRLSRGQVSEMLALGFHETETVLNRCGAEQQATWEELQGSSAALRDLMEE